MREVDVVVVGGGVAALTAATFAVLLVMQRRWSAGPPGQPEAAVPYGPPAGQAARPPEPPR